jgi:hypothetical protein
MLISRNDILDYGINYSTVDDTILKFNQINQFIFFRDTSSYGLSIIANFETSKNPVFAILRSDKTPQLFLLSNEIESTDKKFQDCVSPSDWTLAVPNLMG